MHRLCLFVTFMSQIACAPLNYFCGAFQSGCTMIHLVPTKCPFNTCTYTIMFTLPMPYLKKAPGVSNSCFFVNATQPVKSACKFELPYTHN